MAKRSLTDVLARLRVPLGFSFGVVVLVLAQPTAATLLAGGVVAAIGEALRIWAAGHLNKAREVTSSGPYRWLAHPLYVGSCVMGAGLALASQSALTAILIAVYLSATITAAIRSEDAFLRRTFAEQYARYRDGRLDGEGARRGFSVARAIANHEHRTLAGLAVAVLLLALKATYNRS